MMIDAFLPEGITQLAVDSIFMMPQLGVLAEVNEPKAATEVFEKDCLIHLGTCHRAGRVTAKRGRKPMRSSRAEHAGRHDGRIRDIDARARWSCCPLTVEDPREGRADIAPSGLDVGAGKGKDAADRSSRGGVVGLIFDGARPPAVRAARGPERARRQAREWAKALDAYPA